MYNSEKIYNYLLENQIERENHHHIFWLNHGNFKMINSVKKGIFLVNFEETLDSILKN